MYLDMTYIVLVLPAVIFSLWASWNVKRTYAKYAKQCVNTECRRKWICAKTNL